MVRSVCLSRLFWGLGFAVLLVGCGDSEQISYGICPVPIGNSPQRGPENAWVTIVEFADFQCPYCREVEATIAEVDERHPGLRWVFKHFPIIASHAYAEAAASAADCANAQGKFWEMHDRLFIGESTPLNDSALKGHAEALKLDMAAWSSCFKSDDSLFRVLEDFQQGLSYGVNGTPTFFINGRMLPGLYPVNDMLNVINEAEADAKGSGVVRADYYQTLVEQGCRD